jgi:hopanoid biosynthesis associated protein HpnK
VLPSRQIPDLTDSKGEFSTHLVRTGFKFFFRPGVRKQLEAEIRAQFAKFRGTGLELDHVNAHNHMHLHPTVLRLILKVGKEYGLKGVRVPNEPPLLSWKAAGKALGPRMASWLFLCPWIAVMKHMLSRAGMRYNDYLFGMNDSGAMTEDLVLRFLRNLPQGVTEFCFHPATDRCMEIDRTMPGYRHQDEYGALLSRSLLQASQVERAERIAFSQI